MLFDRDQFLAGDIDFLPTEEYTKGDALRAIADAQFVVSVAAAVIGPQ